MYAQRTIALDRSENAQLILCLRNHFERTWSAFQMHKTSIRWVAFRSILSSHPSRKDWGQPTTIAVRESVVDTFKLGVRDISEHIGTKKQNVFSPNHF